MTFFLFPYWFPLVAFRLPGLVLLGCRIAWVVLVNVLMIAGTVRALRRPTSHDRDA
jgi:hypothetical protein